MRRDLRIRTGHGGPYLDLVDQCVRRDLRIARHFMSRHPGIVNNRTGLDAVTIL